MDIGAEVATDRSALVCFPYSKHQESWSYSREAEITQVQVDPQKRGIAESQRLEQQAQAKGIARKKKGAEDMIAETPTSDIESNGCIP